MATTYTQDESSNIWLKSTRIINSDDIGVGGYSMATTYTQDESSTVWLKSTRTINSDDIGVGGQSMATTQMSYLLSGLRVLVL